MATENQNLQLGLVLRLLKHRLQLGGLHHIAPDLELSLHEHVLSIRLAGDEFGKVVVAEDEGD